MNNKVIIGIIVLVVIVGGALFTLSQSSKMQQQGSAAQVGPSPVMAKNAVTIQNMAFSPASLTVKVGDKVTWTNQDSVEHTATASNNSFDTGVIKPGQSGSNTFAKAGTYAYHCSIHPSMTATIIVQ